MPQSSRILSWHVWGIYFYFAKIRNGRQVLIIAILLILSMWHDFAIKLYFYDSKEVKFINILLFFAFIIGEVNPLELKVQDGRHQS